jgi:hypothetical protein
MLFQILLAVFGIIALAKGEFKITGKRKVSGTVGRVLGVLMLIGAALPLVIGQSGVFIMLGTLILVIIIGLSTSEKIEEPQLVSPPDVQPES